MKLLNRKTVINEAAEQRRQSIEEGLLIARKVDALRQTLASLEKQHADFLGNIQSDLNRTSEVLLNEIALRKLEIVQLSEKRKRLLVPLDNEWEEVHLQVKINNETRDVLAKGLLKLANKQKKVDENYEESKKIKTRINVRERELIKVYEKAEQNIEETEKIKKIAFVKLDKINNYIEQKDKELLSLETIIKK